MLRGGITSVVVLGVLVNDDMNVYLYMIIITMLIMKEIITIKSMKGQDVQEKEWPVVLGLLRLRIPVAKMETGH